MPDLDFHILGSLETTREGEQLALGGAKQRAVLAILVINANRVVTNDFLIEALWPAKRPGKPLTAIQGYVSALRKALAPRPGVRVIVTEPAGYRLPVGADALDLMRFEALAGKGRGALAAEQALEAASAFTEALSLFRGAPLADFAYEDWARPEIERIDELRRACLEERIEADLALGRHAELVGELEALTVQHPLRERFRTQLMLALYRSGRQAEALDVYQATRTVLVDGLGLDPGPDIQALHSRILNQDPALAAPTRQAAALRTARLPTPATSFIGRERELADVTSLIERDDIRLLTLTGPGGTGKTRLALQAAAEVRSGFSDGVFWVPLAPLRDPGLVIRTIAQVLAVQEQSEDALVEVLADTLLDKRTLLLLDNLEHLLPRAASEISRLTEACPTLTVLVTSRERLRIEVETSWPVPSLAASDGERLFIERALRAGVVLDVDHSLRELCRRLDELPLALELAAARTPMLSPAQLLERLERRLDLWKGARDADPRQQTLRATIDWSYQLLEPEEQRVLRALSVFVGGCTLSAAEAVAETDVDTLESLLDKSLIRHHTEEADENRFWMLETIREYAAEHLGASPDGSRALGRLAEWIVDWAGQLDARGPDQSLSLSSMRHELPNARVALGEMSRNARPCDRLRVVVNLAQGMFQLGFAAESKAWLAKALDAGPSCPPALRAQGFAFASIQATLTGEPELGARYAMKAAELAGQYGEYQDAALFASSLAQFGLGNLDASERLAVEALSHASELGNVALVGDIRNNLCYLAILNGNHDLARSLAEDALTEARTGADHYLTATLLQNVSLIAITNGALDEAAHRLAEVLEVSIRHRFDDLMQLGVEGVAAIAGRLGALEEAATLLGATSPREGLALATIEKRLRQETEEHIRTSLGDRRFAKLSADGALLTPEVAARRAERWILDAGLIR